MNSTRAPSLFAGGDGDGDADGDATRVVQVALPIPAQQLFSYAVPPALADDAQVGCRVRVGLQRHSKVGVIVAEGAARENKGAKLRAIDAVLDDAPVLGATLLEALRAEADAVLCPIGLALAAALPPKLGAAPAPRLRAHPRRGDDGGRRHQHARHGDGGRRHRRTRARSARRAFDGRADGGRSCAARAARTG